jgi:acid phosphatase type 7
MKNFGSHRPAMIAVLVLLLLSASPGLVYAGGVVSGGNPVDPVGILLTWQQDPTTTMTIDWHTPGPVAAPVLQYREDGAGAWRTAAAESHAFPFSDRFIHRTELSGLRPAAEYEFRFGEGSRVYRFRTMPTTSARPIRFAAGGDIRHTQEMMEQTNRQVLPYDVDFILWGGDLAYADGREDRAYRWYSFFEAIKNTLVMPDGRVIPIVAAIGNHEVRGGYYHREDHPGREGFPAFSGDDASRARIAPYFYSLFAMPGPQGYNVLDFGDYMSVVLLDSDHSNPADDEQTRWLESVLAERQHVPHVFPIYHVPAYPSVRPFEGDSAIERVRAHWVPLFERYGVRVAFENHDHAYKRTPPIRQNSPNANGVVYIGDGAWGVSTREIGSRDPDREGTPWYLERAEAVRHFILATIHGPHQHFLMIDEDGNIFDEYPHTPGRVLHRYPASEPAAAAGSQ